jgi:hypothetical protein
MFQSSPKSRSGGYECQRRHAAGESSSQRISRQPRGQLEASRLAQRKSKSFASLGMTIRVYFRRFFQQTAKNLASREWLVRVEVSSKSVRGAFIKGMPKRG